MANSIKILLATIYNHLFDLHYRLDTAKWVEVSELQAPGKHLSHARPYVPSTILSLESLFKELKLPKNPILLDIGCGKGLALLVGSLWGCHEVRGVEFSPRLVKVAYKNWKKFQSTQLNSTQLNSTQLKIFHGDACDYHFCDRENVIFLFDPFDNTILNRVANNLKRSLERNPREAIIIYRTPIYAQTMAALPGIIEIEDISGWGHHFKVFHYSNSA